MKVVIAGGSGFIGRALVDEFSSAGYEVSVLSRSNEPVKNATTIVWDAKTVGDWVASLEGAEAVLNVVGENVFTHWTEAKKRRLMSSRVVPTQAIARAIESCKEPPKSWVNASAIGYYGDTGDREVDESSPAGSDFLAEICIAWENAQADCKRTETKKCCLRMGFVLGKAGGAFPLLHRLTKLFLGSAVGNGKHWMPWIHIEDVARIYRLAVEQGLEGPINCVGPTPVRNQDLMGALRQACKRPWVPNVPKPILIAGSWFALPPTEVTLASQRAITSRLKAAGFEYRFPTLEQTFEDLIRP